MGAVVEEWGFFYNSIFVIPPHYYVEIPSLQGYHVSPGLIGFLNVWLCVFPPAILDYNWYDTQNKIIILNLSLDHFILF